jgi:hypothetical protein
LKNEDLQSVIDKAIAYDDKEVLEHLAQSKLLKTAGIMDTLRSMGRGLQLQTRGMGNESQFEDKAQLTSYLTSSSTMRDATESAIILKWWADSLKGLGNATVTVPVEDGVGGYRNINATFPNYVNSDQVINLFDSLSDTDNKKKFPFLNQRHHLESTISSSLGVYTDTDRPSAFNQATHAANGRQIIPTSGLTYFELRPPGTTLVKVSGDSSNPGLIQIIAQYLSQDALAPKEADDIHVKIFSQLARSMNNKAMTSMLRKNAIGGTQKSALDTNWKMIVEMPKMIERRMKVAPKNPMEYKQKLQLKDYGRQLSQLLNTRIEFVDENGLRREEFLFNLPSLKELYDDLAISAQVNPILIQIGNLMNLIQPELDKDTDLYRKYLTKLIPNNRITKEVNTLY